MNSTRVSELSRESQARTTLLLVLSAETVFFATLVMSYLFLRTSGTSNGLTRVGGRDLLFAGINSLVLLLSAATARFGVQAIEQSDTRRLNQSLIVTTLLGAVFVLGQVFEFKHTGLQITGTAFDGAFFALISFHAFHVLAGMTFLVINLVRAGLGDFTRSDHTAIRMSTWFWYYVTGVWFFLFMILYLF